MMSSETDEIVKELFGTLLLRYQGELEESMKGSEFVLKYCITILISLNCGESYTLILLNG